MAWDSCLIPLAFLTASFSWSVHPRGGAGAEPDMGSHSTNTIFTVPYSLVGNILGRQMCQLWWQRLCSSPSLCTACALRSRRQGGVIQPRGGAGGVRRRRNVPHCDYHRHVGQRADRGRDRHAKAAAAGQPTEATLTSTSDNPSKAADGRADGRG